jgi:hypothetical protein
LEHGGFFQCLSRLRVERVQSGLDRFEMDVDFGNWYTTRWFGSRRKARDILSIVSLTLGGWSS